MTNQCPHCGRIISDRERDEQGACDDCYDDPADSDEWDGDWTYAEDYH